MENGNSNDNIIRNVIEFGVELHFQTHFNDIVVCRPTNKV